MNDTPRGRVLVVDDDPAICEFLKAALFGLGFDVRCAGDGITALARVEEFNPDVVISDLLMPGMDGLTLLKALADRLPTMRFVLITGAPSVGVAVEAITQGACDFVMKPLNPDRLAHLMSELVEDRRHGVAPPPTGLVERRHAAVSR